jgi:hypothetical protein
LLSFRAGLAIVDGLAKADAGNGARQRDLAVSYSKLGDVYQRQAKKALAKDALGKGKAIMERITALSPDNAGWKRDLALFERQLIALEWPFEDAKAVIKAAFDAGDFGKAARAQAKVTQAMGEAERKLSGKPGASTASELLSLSWYWIFARDFKGALAASDRAIAIEPENIIHATNKAHALMFLGSAKAAHALYLRYKGQPVEKGGKLWNAAVLEDFQEFEKRGLKHRQMAEIKALLTEK